MKKILWITILALLSAPLWAAPVVYQNKHNYIRFIDGTDADTTVTVFSFTSAIGYEFGEMVGGSFQVLTPMGNATVPGDYIANFAIRNTTTEEIYTTRNGTATLTFDYEIDPSNSQSPLVTEPYYQRLSIDWSYVTGFAWLTTINIPYDGMLVVPEPHTVLLLGFGCLVTAIAGTRRKKLRGKV